MGQSPSTTSHRHDNASTRTLHSSSIHSNRQMSFFKRISQRIQPNRRFGRQNRATTAESSSTATNDTNINQRPSARRNTAHRRQGSSVLMNSGSSTTSSVRRATQEAARAAAAVTGPPILPNFFQYLHQIQDNNGSTRNSITSADSAPSGLSHPLWEVPNIRPQPNEEGTESESPTNNPILRYLQIPSREHDTNTSRTTVTSSGASTNTTHSRRMHILVIEYRQNQTPLSDTHSTQSNASSQPSRTPMLGRRLLGLRRPRSEVSTTSSTETLQSMPLSMHTTATNTTGHPTAPQEGQWVIYLLNGQNTLQALSSTLVDDNPTYEDLLLLGNLLGSVRPNTTTQAAIDGAVPSMEWSEETKERFKDDQCLVCLDEFALEQSVRALKCNHVFHRECVDKWLCESHNSCPVCRRIPV
ncbi:hypothetical protein BY458DRAFT_495767 [Sporodiniella umbellata]|nr:hypothetical protein BY458DRAFT_495767 [Sporodiniella umbellata]